MQEHERLASVPIERLLERMEVASAFGQPTTVGNVTVIPVAAVTLGFGFGAGSGSTSTPAGAEPTTGGGGGGGGGGRAEPRGFIRITPEGVAYEPIMDQARIALAGIAMVAWNVFWIAATIRTVMKAKAERGAD
jgi:uncharacterized spore protein YtfJ